MKKEKLTKEEREAVKAAKKAWKESLGLGANRPIQTAKIN